jgi:soluble lytic murein transglycosylase
LLCLLCATFTAAASLVDDRARFRQAWDAAGRGDRQTFDQLGQGLEGYILYPYFQYEDYRAHRSRVTPASMAVFLEQHADWAFAPGLRTAWLSSMGEQGRWQSLIDHAAGSRDTRVRCYLAQARIELGQTRGLLTEVQSLWTVGKSQPEACDPAFSWLRKQGGITPALAWERIRLAMAAGNPRLTLYLERFVPGHDRDWVKRWQELSRTAYRKLDQSHAWPDRAITRTIVATSLQRLARSDPDRAMKLFTQLDSHFSWSMAERGQIVREIALQAAVALSAEAPSVLAAVPMANQDAQILEWWARAAMAQADWPLLEQVISRMPPEVGGDGRWRYWRAVALRALGDGEAARSLFESLSTETTYYGFLAADALDLPYTICPLEPPNDAGQVTQLRSRPDFARALELRAVGLESWAESEWGGATGRLDNGGLRTAAALAWEEAWYSRVIFALGNSGDRRFYEWRFPVPWEQLVEQEAARRQLDKSWVFGVMRSESALAENARSSAGAMGLMQVTPDTARNLARRHGLPYTGRSQLSEARPNIRFGTTFMRELLDRFDQNPVLVAGAYNAGPEAVERWLRTRPRTDIATWVETIPYFETRDYIPRVLAFTAIYDWRLGLPVTRVSSRMPAFDSGNMMARQTTAVVCRASG